MLSVLAGFLLLMVTLGLTGVVWQSVIVRLREFGLRRAAGASGASVRRQVFAEMAVMTSFAVIAGTAIVGQLPFLPLPEGLVVAGAGVRRRGCADGGRHLLSDPGVRLVSEPARGAHAARRRAALRVAIARSMILIIDDDQAVTASLALLLKQAGFASTPRRRRTRRSRCCAASPASW